MYNLAGGGAERVLVDLLDEIDYEKYNVDLLLIRKEGIYIDDINRNVNIKSIFSYDNSFNNKIFNYIKSLLYKYVPKFFIGNIIGKKYAVEISFLEGETSSLLLYSKNKNSKKVAWIHTDLEKMDNLNIIQEKKIYNIVDKIICVSNDCKDSFLKLYPEYKEKIKVIYNLLNKSKILKLGNKKEVNLPSYNYILSIGRLTKEKRFDRLIKAYKLLVDKGIKQDLIILGEGNLKTSLENLVDELDLKERVFFPGFTKNPYYWIKNSDLFVLASDLEGFSLVVAEAMILGKAIVSTDCVGPTELLGNGEYGIVTQRDKESLKCGIESLLLDEEKKFLYEKKALERSKIFNKEIFNENINRILEM
ncbi:MAG: glycosyltransferase [Intestinibacter bartlettii]|uniref:glycosyltransferase n=1 Tax=Intestinibacter bartlettii TaxID=261299 RepID=UPI00399B3ACB